MPQCLQKLWLLWQKRLERVTAWYGRNLRLLLQNYRGRALGAALVLFLLSLCLYPLLGSTFMPASDQAQFTTKVRASADATAEMMDKQSAELTQVLQQIPEVRHVYATTAKREHNLFVQLVPKKERSRSQKEIIAEVRQRFNAIPGVRADFVDSDDKPLAISVTGSSSAELVSLADAVQQELEQVPGVQDIASTYHAGLPNLNLALREDRASDLGVSSAAVGTTMQTLLSGVTVGKFSDKDERVDIRLCLSGDGRSRTDMLRQVYVPSEHQAISRAMLVPLSQVAS
jgi:HAE1 family hydrophobic/amphiphilic exporter-1